MKRKLIIALALACCPVMPGLQTAAKSDGGLIDQVVEAMEASEDAAVQASLMRGLLAGLDGRRNVDAPQGWERLGQKLAQSDAAETRALAQQLSQLFGDREAIAAALGLLGDKQADPKDRRRALRTLLAQQNAEVGPLLVQLLDDPIMRTDAIRGFAESENVKAPELLLEAYATWPDDERRAVLETLASREGYAGYLLGAIEREQVSRDDVPAHVARSLSLVLGDDFVNVFGDVRQLSQDREKLLAKYKKMVTPQALAKADPSRGRAIFQKTCASCHVLYGEGAKIGPDLTGSNRANLDYILLNSVDPSYDVPEGYKMVLIQTVDGRLLNGVVAEEDDRRVVLKTVEQPRVVISQEDIEARKVSPKSMMPDGQLDQMKPRDVIDLIRYLRTTEQVELPK